MVYKGFTGKSIPDLSFPNYSWMFTGQYDRVNEKCVTIYSALNLIDKEKRGFEEKNRLQHSHDS